MFTEFIKDTEWKKETQEYIELFSKTHTAMQLFSWCYLMWGQLPCGCFNHSKDKLFPPLKSHTLRDSFICKVSLSC